MIQIILSKTFSFFALVLLLNFSAISQTTQCGVPVYVPYSYCGGPTNGCYPSGYIVAYQSGGVWRKYQSIYNFNGNLPTNTGWWTNLGCCDAPSAPSASSATNISNTSLSANWGSVSGATAYSLDVSTSSSFIPLLSGYPLNVGNVTTRSVTDLTVGTTYYYRVRATSGCGTSSNSSSISATTTSPSVGGTIAGSASVCTGTNSTTLTLSGHTGAVTRWEWSAVSNFASGVNIVANTTTTLTATNLTATRYYRAIVTNGSCSAATSATASITVSSVSVGGTIAGSATVCTGTNSTTLTLSGHIGNVVRWESSASSSFASGVTCIANTSTTLTVSNLIATTYYRAVVQSGSCTNFVTRTITVNEKVNPTFTLPTSICSGTALTLPTTSTNSITGTWSPAFNNNVTTTYTFTPTEGLCANIMTQKIIINEKVTPTFAQVAAICEGTEFDLPIVSENGITGTWSPELSNLTTTTYTFTPTNGNCVSTNKLIVVVNPKLTPSFDIISSICTGDSIFDLPQNSLNGIIGSWFPSLNNQQTTEYTFTPNDNFCASQTSSTLVVNPIVTIDTNVIAFQTYTWQVNGQTYYSSGNYSFISGCSENKLNLTITCTLDSPGLISDIEEGLCLSGLTNPSFLIAPVSNASSYLWTVPSGVTIVSGQGTTSVALAISNSFSSGTLSVSASNECGTSPLRSIMLRSTIPLTPLSISGITTGLCLSGVINPSYSIADVSGASSYTWSAPVGTTIVSGQGTTSVTLEVSSSFVSGTLSVTANNLCGSSTAKTLALSSTPIAPGIITGSSNNLCLNGLSNPTYSIAAVAGASSYTWTAPIGTTIVSGQGTTSVTLAVSGSFVSGPLSVKSNNSCSSSISRTLALYSVPLTPVLITGATNNLCPNGVNNPTYSIAAVAGASSYTWTAPIGTTIVSGQGTTSVTLEVSGSFVSGTLSVIANNLCGSSTAKTLAISSIPFAPGTITGISNDLCPNGVSNPTYSITSVIGASSYIWTAPIGTTIVSGQGTTSVTLEVSDSFVSGTLSVIANNVCGSGTAKTLALSSLPVTPGIITGPSNNLCPNGVSNPTYSIAAVAGASSYTWTAPVGTTIVSGQGTTSVILQVSSSFVSGTISVITNNLCGSSTAQSLALSSIPFAPGIITGPPNNLCLNGLSNPTYTISAVSGASSYTWTAPIGTTIVSGQGTTSVTLAVSGSFVSGPLSVKSNNSCSSSISRTLALYSVPLTPGLISGTTNNLCLNGVNNPTYTISAIPGASSYTWTAPIGTTIVSGQGTTSVTLEVSGSFVSGTLSVTANNLCGSSTAKTLALSSIPFAPGTITGTSNNLCPNGVSNPTYTIASVSGASSYTWTAPIGTTIVSGQGTTSITLEVSSSFVSGTLSVIANNLCGSSIVKTLALSSIPVTPGIITGISNNLCPNGVSNPTYSIAAVAGASNYTWTAPVGTTIVSGQGTTSIILQVLSSFSSGAISVVANNGCRTSVARTMSLSNIPLTPTTITGSSTPCGITTYSCANVSQAVSYTWSVPTGLEILSGQGTNSITVNVLSSTVSGLISVRASNDCKTGNSRTLSIGSCNQKQLTFSTSESQIEEQNNLNVLIYPNPFNDIINLEFLEEFKEEVYVEIYDFLGKIILRNEIKPGTKLVNMTLDGMTHGVYLLKASKSNGVLIYTSKILKQ